jgi:cell division protein FtsW (lipid II flippase)
MREWLKQNSSTVWPWAALIVGATVIFVVSRGTSSQQCGLALLVASISLLVSITLFEVILQTVTRWLGHRGRADTTFHTPGAWRARQITSRE